MANDRPIAVEWKGGRMVVHQASEDRAIDVVIEYLRSMKGKLITAKFLDNTPEQS